LEHEGVAWGRILCASGACPGSRGDAARDIKTAIDGSCRAPAGGGARAQPPDRCRRRGSSLQETAPHQCRTNATAATQCAAAAAARPPATPREARTFGQNTWRKVQLPRKNSNTTGLQVRPRELQEGGVAHRTVRLYLPPTTTVYERVLSPLSSYLLPPWRLTTCARLAPAWSRPSTRKMNRCRALLPTRIPVLQALGMCAECKKATDQQSERSLLPHQRGGGTHGLHSVPNINHGFSFVYALRLDSCSVALGSSSKHKAACGHGRFYGALGVELPRPGVEK